MQIERDKVVAFSYQLKNEAGEEVERSADNDPMVYLHGHRNMMLGLEVELEGRLEGAELSVTLPPEKAYGLRKEGSAQRVPIKHLVNDSGKKKKYRPGMTVKINTKEGPRDVVVVKVGKFNLDVDTNHPLAGKTVTFDIKIETIRDATAEERAHGHSHGAQGHDHH